MTEREKLLEKAAQDFIGYREGMRDALNDLQSAEAFYRKVHDFNGDGHIHTGRAWDKLRKAGDRARAALDGTEEIANQIIAQVCTCGGDLKQLPAHHDISCPASLSTAPPEQPAAAPEVQFLLDRLEEYDPEDEDHVRDFHGHVAPAIARLRNAVTSTSDDMISVNRETDFQVSPIKSDGETKA